MTDHEHRSGKGTQDRVITETRAREHDDTRGGVYHPAAVMGRGAGFFRGLSWGAVIAGALVAFIVMAVLNLLGVAIGAATYDVGVAQPGLGIGAGIWFVLTMLIALFCGGWVAGRLSDSMDRGEGLIHGIVTWALFLFASLWALTTAAGAMLGGAFNLIGQNLGAVLGQQPMNLQAIEAAMIEAGVDQQAITAVQAEAVIAGEQAADALAIGATWAFVAMLLGVLIAAFGSLLGSAMPPEGREERSDRARRVLRPRTA